MIRSRLSCFVIWKKAVWCLRASGIVFSCFRFRWFCFFLNASIWISSRRSMRNLADGRKLKSSTTKIDSTKNDFLIFFLLLFIVLKLMILNLFIFFFVCIIYLFNKNYTEINFILLNLIFFGFDLFIFVYFSNLFWLIYD